MFGVQEANLNFSLVLCVHTCEADHAKKYPTELFFETWWPLYFWDVLIQETVIHLTSDFIEKFYLSIQI